MYPHYSDAICPEPLISTQNVSSTSCQCNCHLLPMRSHDQIWSWMQQSSFSTQVKNILILNLIAVQTNLQYVVNINRPRRIWLTLESKIAISCLGSPWLQDVEVSHSNTQQWHRWLCLQAYTTCRRNPWT